MGFLENGSGWMERFFRMAAKERKERKKLRLGLPQKDRALSGLEIRLPQIPFVFFAFFCGQSKGHHLTQRTRIH
ncbi:MAG: hypothetical protein ACAH88_10955 [Roseimicrobium sp.]